MRCKTKLSRPPVHLQRAPVRPTPYHKTYVYLDTGLTDLQGPLAGTPVCSDLYRALLASVPVHRTSFPALIHIGRRPTRHVREETQRHPKPWPPSRPKKLRTFTKTRTWIMRTVPATQRHTEVRHMRRWCLREFLIPFIVQNRAE